MKFKMNYFHSSPLLLAVEKQNIEIVRLLLSCDNIDVNSINICNHNLFI